MKKVLLVSLLLVGIFLMCNANVALAQCWDFQCDGILTQYGMIDDIYETCVELCIDSDPFYLFGGWFTCYLYPTDIKNLLGTAASEYDWAGCSVEGKGRNTIKVTLTYIQEDEGYIDELTCTPCNDCCNGG